MPLDLNYNLLPEHIREGMRLYIEHGVLPGGFLEAVIENNLVESFARADDINLERMFYIAKFVYAEMPMKSWGSKEKMITWHEHGGMNGLLKKPE